jgi:hypothetical protein
MPSPNVMTWEPVPRRWRKMYRGEVYTVSCRELDAPETKDGSRGQANEWWTAKRAELDARPKPVKPILHPIIRAEMEERRVWAQDNDI